MRLRSIGLISTLVLGLLATPLTAEAQQAGKVYRVGVLRFRGSPDHPNVQAFRQGLRDLGWVEGQNITLEYRWAKGRRDRLPNLQRNSSGSRLMLSLLLGTERLGS